MDNVQNSTEETINSKCITSFVAWGADPEEDGNNAVEAGIWSNSDYIYYTSLVDANAAEIYENESIGLYPQFSNFYSSNWSLFTGQLTSQGYDNPVPSIMSFSPGPGENMDGSTFSIDWNFVDNAIGYHFQMDDKADFISPIDDLILDSPAFVSPTIVPEGLYYWRVKVLFPNNLESDWSPVIDVNSLESGDILETKTLDIEWQLQRKDTNMLCLFGDKETGDAPWDSEHPIEGGVKAHAINYCSRATISMIASYYGAELSQDRIAFEDLKDTSTCHYDSCNQLGHERTNWTYIDDLFEDVGITGISWTTTLPDFSEIAGYINNLRPIVVRASRYGREYKIGYHFLVIDGYRIEEKDGHTIQKIHLLDPWDRDNWVVYDEYKGYIII